MDRLRWVEQFPHYVSFIDQSVEAAARLVVADRLIAPFELSKQSKLIIGQLRHQSLRWFRRLLRYGILIRCLWVNHVVPTPRQVRGMSAPPRKQTLPQGVCL